MRKIKHSSDGLIGMWLHTFDDDGDIDLQLEVIRRSGDVYICKVYSWDNGYPTDCVVLHRNKILSLPLYESSYRLNLALEKHKQQWRERQQQLGYRNSEPEMHNVITFPSVQSQDLVG
jgi:hypothetical protein